MQTKIMFFAFVITMWRPALCAAQKVDWRDSFETRFFGKSNASFMPFFAGMRVSLTLLCILFFTCEAMSQTSVKLNLPKAEEIERIEISQTSMINWYKPAELLKLLPRFVASEGTYLTKQPFQRGTFVLKNGKRIAWMANYTDSILLYEGSTEQLFVLPKKDQPIFSIWDADGKAGFIDVNGKTVWKLQTDAVGDFSEGLAPVLVGDKWGYANRAGEIVIEPRWKTLTQGWLPTVGSFSEGLAAVIEAVHWDVIADSNYYAYKCGYINTKGEYVIPPKFRQSCGEFSDGLARISVDWQGDEYEEGKGWIGFLDKQGDWAIKPQFFEAGNFADG
ncbi:MAG: WG repeat-containing protein, partial [Pyrinomonadaceae bacterium]